MGAKALGRRLAAWRKTRGLIQDDVARLVNSTRSTVAGVERGEQVVDRVFWVQCESLLHAGGELIAGYDEYRSFEISHREERADAARHARWDTVLSQRLCLSSGRWVCLFLIFEDSSVDDVGEAAFQGPPGFGRCLTFAEFALART